MIVRRSTADGLYSPPTAQNPARRAVSTHFSRNYEAGFIYSFILLGGIDFLTRGCYNRSETSHNTLYIGGYHNEHQANHGRAAGADAAAGRHDECPGGVERGVGPAGLPARCVGQRRGRAGRERRSALRRGRRGSGQRNHRGPARRRGGLRGQRRPAGQLAEHPAAGHRFPHVREEHPHGHHDHPVGEHATSGCRSPATAARS